MVLPADVGKHFYLMDYRRHYEHFLEALSNKKRVISELFLFRAWATQFAFRMTSESEECSEKIIYEIVNLTNTLAKGIVEMTAKINIEKQLGGKFVELLEERWSDYDQVVIDNKNMEVSWLLTQLCIRLMDKCGITRQDKFDWLLNDLLGLMGDIIPNEKFS